MPKAKPTQVIVHRLELQQTERDTLEAALAGKFVTDAVSAAGSVISGFANVLKPFEGAITALAVLWIGDKTLDEIKELADKASDEVLDFMFPELEDTRAYYTFILQWSRANSDWNQWLNRDYEVEEHLEKNNAWPFLIQAFRNFRKEASQLRSAGGARWHNDYATHSPAAQFSLFYPFSQYWKDVQAAMKETIERKTKVPFFGPVFTYG